MGAQHPLAVQVHFCPYFSPFSCNQEHNLRRYNKKAAFQRPVFRSNPTQTFKFLRTQVTITEILEILPRALSKCHKLDVSTENVRLRVLTLNRMACMNKLLTKHETIATCHTPSLDGLYLSRYPFPLSAKLLKCIYYLYKYQLFYAYTQIPHLLVTVMVSKYQLIGI